MLSPFHACYKARQLSELRNDENFVAVFASSDIEIYPYQVAAATFALRSPFLKGVILCDEGSLGKTYEALLIIAQKFYDGRQNILIVVPTPLLHQLTKIMDNKFSIPFAAIDNNENFDNAIVSETEDEIGNMQNPFRQDGVVITTYDFAVEKQNYISQISWDMTVFEEAHCLRKIYTGENKTANAMRILAGDSFKLLLTATPMQNSIMDLYGLIYFIDETVLPESDEFYKLYFRKPENYPELADRISKFCFRTMRGQVATYVKIPERIPITVDFELSKNEQKLNAMLDSYLARAKKYAFPKMELYDLTLMLFRNFSSSTFALAKTLQGVERRLNEIIAENSTENSQAEIVDEHNHISSMLKLANEITTNAKGRELLSALKKGFAELKKLGANKKAMIFTDNRETQKYLVALLNENGYKGKVLKFNGDYSRDYTIMERFQSEATILVTTDIAAEGFNLEFCSFVINYDLPYNTLTIEQRINRCHRQGQQTDVLVLNFLNRNNFADVRMLELINKRILQYDGIIGLSDNVIGNIGASLNHDFAKIMAGAKSKAEIDKAFDEVLADYETENKQLVKTTQDLLFTTFDRDIAKNLAISPQYIEERADRANYDLWELTKFFFGKRREFTIDDETRTIRCSTIHPPKVFTGTALRRGEYSMQKGYQPASGRHTLTGSLARNMLYEIFWKGLPDSGNVVVDSPTSKIEPCEIAYYRIKVKSPSDYFNVWYYNVFVGKTRDGRTLTQDECVEIMEMPVSNFTADTYIYGGRDGLSNPKRSHPFDSMIDPSEYTARTIEIMDGAIKEEIDQLTRLTKYRKIALERNIIALRNEVTTLNNTTTKAANIAEKIQAEKRKTATQKELKQKEQQLFLDGMRLDVELEGQIKKLADDMKLTAKIKREFVISVRSE